MFAERGFPGTRIESVCDRAWYTRGAFYASFKAKDELFFVLFDARAAKAANLLAWKWKFPLIDRGKLILAPIAEGLAGREADARPDPRDGGRGTGGAPGQSLAGPGRLPPGKPERDMLQLVLNPVSEDTGSRQQPACARTVALGKATPSSPTARRLHARSTAPPRSRHWDAYGRDSMPRTLLR